MSFLSNIFGRKTKTELEQDIDHLFSEGVKKANIGVFANMAHKYGLKMFEMTKKGKTVFDAVIEKDNAQMLFELLNIKENLLKEKNNGALLLAKDNTSKRIIPGKENSFDWFLDDLLQKAANNNSEKCVYVVIERYPQGETIKPLSRYMTETSVEPTPSEKIRNIIAQADKIRADYKETKKSKAMGCSF